MKYSVILAEQLEPEKIDASAELLSERLKLSPKQVTKLLSRKPGPITKAISKEQADKVVELLQPLGISLSLKEIAKDNPTLVSPIETSNLVNDLRDVVSRHTANYSSAAPNFKEKLTSRPLLKLGLSTLLGILALCSFLLSIGTSLQQLLLEGRPEAYESSVAAFSVIPNSNGIIALGILFLLVAKMLISSWRPQAKFNVLLNWLSVPLLVLLIVTIGLQLRDIVA